MAQIMPKILGMADLGVDEQAETCLISLDNAIDTALITDRGSSIASLVHAMEDRITQAVGVENQFTGMGNGHLYENQHNDPNYCGTAIWPTLFDISDMYSQLIPSDFYSNDVSFNSLFVYQPLYATATRLYKVMLDLALGCPYTDTRANIIDDSISHEDFVANAYSMAIEKMNELLDYMSIDNANTRIGNISCHESCSSSGQSDGCKDSTCTCECFHGSNTVKATTQSWSTRTYNIVCTDAGISDWSETANWSCTIRDQTQNVEWYEVWKSKDKKQCWKDDHECNTESYKTTQIKDAGYNTYRDAIKLATIKYREEIQTVASLVQKNAIDLSYSAFNQYFYVDDGCHSEGNSGQDDTIGYYGESSETHSVRCCSNDGKSCISADTNNGFECEENLTYAEAVEYCDTIPGNYRLCTAKELLSDICCGTGCGHDSHPVWTSTEVKYRGGFNWVIYYDVVTVYENPSYSQGANCEIDCAADDNCYGYAQHSDNAHQCYRYTNNIVQEQSSKFDNPIMLKSFNADAHVDKWSVFFKQKAVLTIDDAYRTSNFDYSLSCGNRPVQQIALGLLNDNMYFAMLDTCRTLCYDNGCISYQLSAIPFPSPFIDPQFAHLFPKQKLYSCQLTYLHHLDERTGLSFNTVVEPPSAGCVSGGCESYYGMDIVSGTFEPCCNNGVTVSSDIECQELCSNNTECTAWVTNSPESPSSIKCWMTSKTNPVFEIDTKRNGGLSCSKTGCFTEHAGKYCSHSGNDHSQSVSNINECEEICNANSCSCYWYKSGICRYTDKDTATLMNSSSGFNAYVNGACSQERIIHEPYLSPTDEMTLTSQVYVRIGCEHCKTSACAACGIMLEEKQI